MPKFQILGFVEHGSGGDDVKLYVPKGTLPAAHWSPLLDADGKQTGWTSPSAGFGRRIPVDSSGTIELTALQAGPLRAAGAIAAGAIEEEGTEEQEAGNRGQETEKQGTGSSGQETGKAEA